MLAHTISVIWSVMSAYVSSIRIIMEKEEDEEDKEDGEIPHLFLGLVVVVNQVCSDCRWR